jgi:hypothetical protein
MSRAGIDRHAALAGRPVFGVAPLTRRQAPAGTPPVQAFLPANPACQS